MSIPHTNPSRKTRVFLWKNVKTILQQSLQTRKKGAISTRVPRHKTLVSTPSDGRHCSPELLDTIYTIPPFTIPLPYPVGFILNLSPSKPNTKPFTPSSVKGLMIIEAAVLAFLGIWLTNEY